MPSPLRMRSVADLVALLRSGAGLVSDDEAVDELSHALQTAGQALQGGADGELVVAAALHDVGRYPPVQARYPGLAHEEAGARFCRELFGERVGWLVGAHVAAKRYLVVTDRRYAALLSPASVASLSVQGGGLNPAEVEAFGAHPWAWDAVALRRWDDLAKVPGAPAPPLERLVPLFELLGSFGAGRARRRPRADY